MAYWLEEWGGGWVSMRNLNGVPKWLTLSRKVEQPTIVTFKCGIAHTSSIIITVIIRYNHQSLEHITLINFAYSYHAYDWIKVALHIGHVRKRSAYVPHFVSVSAFESFTFGFGFPFTLAASCKIFSASSSLSFTRSHLIDSGTNLGKKQSETYRRKASRCIELDYLTEFLGWRGISICKHVCIHRRSSKVGAVFFLINAAS